MTEQEARLPRNDGYGVIPHKTPESRNDEVWTIPFPLTLIARRLVAEAIHKNATLRKNAESTNDSNDFKKQYEKDIQGKKWIYKV